MLRHPLFLFVIFMGVGSGVGCPSGDTPFESKPTQVIFAPSDSDFWSLPLPSDLREQEDGTFNLEQWPGDWDNELTSMWLRAADRRLTQGWGVSSGIFQTFSAPIDPTSFPETPSASMESNASVFLINVDFASPSWGARIPLELEFRETSDRYTPDNVLAAVPIFGFTREANTQYALVLTTELKDANGDAIGRSEEFHRAFEQDPEAEPSHIAHFAGVRSTLLGLGFELDKVAGAAVFTTMDPTRELRDLAIWAETLEDPYLAEPWTIAEEYDSYQVLTSTYEVPIIQEGTRPYENIGEGLIMRAEDGTPIVVERQAVRLALTVPKQAQPENGFPLTIYMHGSGGEWYQAINRSPRPELPPDEQGEGTPGLGPAHWLALRGIATLGFDFPLHGSRNEPSDTTGLLLYNILGNIDTTIDNFNVAAMELTLLSRLVTTMSVDASIADTLNAGNASDGLIRFDSERLSAMGQSMGSTLGIAWATIDPRVQGYMFSGSGGILVEIATTATEPFAFRGLLETLVELDEDQQIHRFHPLLHTFQNLWDMVDPIAKAKHISREPFPGFEPRDIFMSAGIIDGYFSPRSQAAMAVALGTEHVGEQVDEMILDSLSLAGYQQHTYPLSKNLNGRVSGVVEYESPYSLGHYVMFNQEGARYQLTCFIKSVGSPEGAVIPEARGLDDPCPGDG